MLMNIKKVSLAELGRETQTNKGGRKLKITLIYSEPLLRERDIESVRCFCFPNPFFPCLTLTRLWKAKRIEKCKYVCVCGRAGTEKRRINRHVTRQQTHPFSILFKFSTIRRPRRLSAVPRSCRRVLALSAWPACARACFVLWKFYLLPLLPSFFRPLSPAHSYTIFFPVKLDSNSIKHQITNYALHGGESEYETKMTKKNVQKKTRSE